jgi:hypothetical protein
MTESTKFNMEVLVKLIYERHKIRNSIEEIRPKIEGIKAELIGDTKKILYLEKEVILASDPENLNNRINPTILIIEDFEYHQLAYPLDDTIILKKKQVIFTKKFTAFFYFL